MKVAVTVQFTGEIPDEYVDKLKLLTLDYVSDYVDLKLEDGTSVGTITLTNVVIEEGE